MKTKTMLLLTTLLLAALVAALALAPPSHAAPATTSYLRRPAASAPIVNIDTKYNRQGVFEKQGLLRDHDSGKLKPLLGRQVSSDRYQFFTSENHDGFLLNVPLFDQQGRSCTSGAGCAGLFDGDTLRGLDGGTYSFLSL